jgi:hypothetical protein
MQVATLTTVTVIVGLGGVGAGCLDRPLITAEPTTKTSFTTVQKTNSISKVDLLFDIDNSASMGDKQAYLEQAVPDLITRLVTPNCVNSTPSATPGGPPSVTVIAPSVGGVCAMGTIEFAPVHDMHIGIISSSLGTRGVTTSGAVCNPAEQTGTPAPAGAPFLDGMPQLSNHNDDQGHLLSRIAPTFAPPVTAAQAAETAEQETPTLADVGTENFLDWFPTPQPEGYTTSATGGIDPLGMPPGPVLTPATPLTNIGALGMEPGTLEGDFAALVAGTHAYGCGIESQLETWYRFLIQPDPYASIAASSAPATWVGIDQTILQQRHDFLRPDSLVAIIVLTDENDSEIDVRSFSGQGYLFMDSTYGPLHGTQACTTEGPQSANCISCGYPQAKGDPNCMAGNNSYPATPGNDPGFYINVRHVHMQQKYGISAQFPLQRYYLGLTNPFVPDRDHEYPAGAGAYQGGTILDAQGNIADPTDLDCANPLFAGSLPTGLGTLTAAQVCNADQAGTASRGANLVFYAHIGGVPHQLLQLQPGTTDPVTGTTCAAGTPATECPQKDTLGVVDWTTILGAGLGATTGTGAFNYTGIDPHMIEAFNPNSPTMGRTSTTGTPPVATTIPVVPATGVPIPGAVPAPDPISGWDWQTDTLNGTVPAHVLPVDREYACIFPLVDATGVATPRDCSGGPGDPLNSYACDCESLGLPAESVPAVCGLKNPNAPIAQGTPAGPLTAAAPAGINDYTTQYFAKTYPTIRELTLANMMGNQGVISSLCPIHTVATSATDPLYGYRPAVNAIVNRLKNALASQCLPQPLAITTNSDGGETVPCLILATLAPGNGMTAADEATACSQPGLGIPEPQVLQAFQASQHAAFMAGTTTGQDLSLLATCTVFQNPPNSACATNKASPLGWCYIDQPSMLSGSSCQQEIQFTANSPPNGSTLSLQCLLATGDGGAGD